MKMTHHRFKLLFQKGTTVIPEPSLQIRDSGFSFCSMFEILEKKSDYHYLIDFIGVITSVRHQTEVDYYGKKLKLMILEIYADGVQKHSHENFYCQVCDKNIDNVIASYRDFNHPLHHAFFEVVVGKELILKIEFTELIKEEFGGMFKVITILDDRQTGLGLSVDSHINDTFQAPAYTPICEADFHYSEIEKYTSRIPFDASIDANNIDEMLLDSISTGFNCATPDP
ncbi:hypothetical protein HN873_045968, partial [Arachis hypogaea]